MISIYNIKPKFQKLLSPVLVSLHQYGVTANQITISSIFLSLAIGLLFWFANQNQIFFLALPLGLFVRMALNALDGMMARTYNQQSHVGEMLNELGDVVSDIFIFLPLLKHEPENSYIIIVFICLSIVNEFAGIMGKVLTGDRRYEGPMGKSDRAFVLGLYGLLRFFTINMKPLIFYVFAVVVVLLIISTITRINKALK